MPKNQAESSVELIVKWSHSYRSGQLVIFHSCFDSNAERSLDDFDDRERVVTPHFLDIRLKLLVEPILPESESVSLTICGVLGPTGGNLKLLPGAASEGILDF